MLFSKHINYNIYTKYSINSPNFYPYIWILAFIYNHKKYCCNNQCNYCKHISSHKIPVTSLKRNFFQCFILFHSYPLNNLLLSNKEI